MDESTQTETAAGATSQADTAAAESAAVELETGAAPAVADALASDTAQPTAVPRPSTGPVEDAPAQDEQIEHPVITSMREELDKIANMPAHIWQAIEGAFEWVAQKL